MPLVFLFFSSLHLFWYPLLPTPSLNLASWIKLKVSFFVYGVIIISQPPESAFVSVCVRACVHDFRADLIIADNSSLGEANSPSLSKP